MLQRLLTFICVMMLLTLALQGCTPGYSFNVQLAKVNGKPHMLVEYVSPTYSERGERYFSIYTPKSANWDEWDALTSDRLGRAYTLYAAPTKAAPASEKEKNEKPDETPGEQKSPPPPAEKLGLTHDLRVTLLDINAKPPTQTFETLPFSWKGETAVTRKGITYVFGVSDTVYETEQHEGTLMVARYDGQKWEELKPGPKVRGNDTGFWLQAIETPTGMTVLWRGLDLDAVIWPNLEGPRAVTEGALTLVAFNGETFETPVTVTNIPRGNGTAWADGETIKVLLQTRHKNDDAISHNGAMEIWNVSPGGGAERVEEIEGSKNRGGLLAYLQVEHLAVDGADYVVRSNMQMFEIWKKTPDIPWTRVAYKPRGLPVYDLESALLAGVALSIALIAFGAALAYHRRKQALALLHKVSSRELYASLGLRSGAYMVDLCVVMGVTYLLAKSQGWPFVSPALMLLNFISEQHWPFFGVYLVYFVLTEWLFGASAGKFIMGLSVVMDGGERISLWSAVVRNLVGFVERLPVIATTVTLWMILLGPRRQRMGDILSRTFVVQKGALEAFKAQRAQDIALRKANQQSTQDLETGILPPVDTGWDTGRKKAKSDEKGPRT
jgi:uncharacterized RDD family membrane protein YckC